jgi:hypothetical protein
MIFAAPLVGVAVGTGAAYALNSKAKPSKIVHQLAPVASATSDSFDPSTIKDYIEVRDETSSTPPRYVTYSTHHKLPLATHTLITKKDVESSKDIKTPGISGNYFLPRQTVLNNFFSQYSSKLIRDKTCDSVELIEGPIFSKASKFEPKSEEEKKMDLSQIYRTTISIDEKGEHKPDYFYKIVVCNTQLKGRP